MNRNELFSRLRTEFDTDGDVMIDASGNVRPACCISVRLCRSGNFMFVDCDTRDSDVKRGVALRTKEYTGSALIEAFTHRFGCVCIIAISDDLPDTSVISEFKADNFSDIEKLDV